MNLSKSNDEIWKDIKIEGGKYIGLYQASNLGNIKSLANNNTGSVRKEKILKPGKNAKTNYLVSLWKDGKGKMFIVKHLVWNTFKGTLPKGYVIKHKDNNIKNCRLNNLEMITCREHSTRTGITRGKTSKYTGVSLTKGRWRAQININGKVKHLGYRDTEEEAAKLYQQALTKI